MKTKRRSITKKNVIHVAVVWRGGESLSSARPLGDWACFLGSTQEDAVNRALRAADGWNSERRGRDYQVYVGTVNARASRKAEFVLEAL